MRSSHFKKKSKFFHLNIHFKTTGYFKSLDWIYLQRLIHNAAVAYSVEVQALVMMDTHFHVLIESATNQENFFSNLLENTLAHKSEPEAFCEPVKFLAQYLIVYKYIYNNPVKAGLCKYVEDYAFSSVQTLLGKSAAYCLISDRLDLIHNPQRVLKWLNSEMEFKESKLKSISEYKS